jgi:predicted CoA-binding protein
MPSEHGFLDGSNIAVFGVSPRRKTFAADVREKLQGAGYNVYGINPDGGEGYFPNWESLPEKTDRAYIATSPVNAAKILDSAIAAGVKKVWLQFGSYNKDLLQKCKAAGLETHTGCLMMYIPDAGFIHSFHRFIHELIKGKP